MKQTFFRPLSFALSMFLICFLAFTSCNEPSIIGAEVIDPDRPDVEFTDTLTILATTVQGDSIQTYDNLSLLSSLFCGNLDDPIFGNSQAIINTQLRVTGAVDSIVFQEIPMGTSVLDSAFFIFEYDTASFYGKNNSTQNISIYLLDEAMDNINDYYSDVDFNAVPGPPIAQAMLNPSQYDTTLFRVVGTDSIYPPQMRIPIPVNHTLFTDALWNEDSYLYYQSDSALLTVLNGIKIQADTSSATPLMMSLFPRSSLSGMHLYYHYTNDSIIHDDYRFQISSNAAQMVHFRNDTQGAIVEDFIENTTNGDSLFFVGGMAGLNTKISFPTAKNLGNVIINHAQLVFTVATMLPEDDLIFHDNPIDQLLLVKKNQDDEFNIISDLAAANLIDLEGVFGGNLTTITKNGVELRKYTMNISDHFQDIVNGIEPSDEIFVLAFAKAEFANRSIIFGPGHSQYPVKLNVTYTINQ